MCGKLGWAASTVFCGSVCRLAGDGVATGPPCRGQGPLGQQAAEGADAYVLGRASDRRPGAAGAPTPDWPGQCPPLGRDRDLDQPGPTGPTQGPGSMQHTAGPEGPAFPQAADCRPQSGHVAMGAGGACLQAPAWWLLDSTGLGAPRQCGGGGAEQQGEQRPLPASGTGGLTLANPGAFIRVCSRRRPEGEGVGVTAMAPR